MEREHDSLQQLAGEMQSHPGVDDWSIRAMNEHSWQLFAANQRTDTRREVYTHKLNASIFHDLPQNGGSSLRGSASFTLVPSPTLGEDAQRALDQALLMARTAGNPYYTLPQPPAQGYPVVQSCDQMLLERPQEALEELFATITASISKESQLIASSTEIFATTSTIRFVNSNGIDAMTQSTSLTLEMILIANDGSNDAEHSLLTRRCRLSDLEVEALIQRNARFARDSLRAQLPSTHQGPVVISGEALVDLFSPLIYHSSAQTAYQSLSKLRIGEPLSSTTSAPTTQPGATKLTLASNRTLPYGIKTLAFDEEGIPAMDTVLIQDGIVQRYWADHRHAGYLGIPVTGSFGNIAMAAGHESYHALLSQVPMYEIVAFSWMQPDVQTGNFVAEIRLGYLHTAGGTTPIKGGSLSGNVFAAFSNFAASAETQFTGKYAGPLAIRFDDLSISGR